MTTDAPGRMTAEPRKYDFIDALRGLAILAVILVHAQGAVAPHSAWLQVVMAAGARGVQLFYVASALTLSLSWQFRSGHEHAPLRNFYLRRLFRIVPMFYIAIVGYLVMYGLAPRYYAPDGVRWFHVPLTALFLHGFHPETITSVVPGGWSIAVEMTFYLVFPLLIRWSRSLISLALMFGISLLLARGAAALAYALFRHAYSPERLYLVDALSTLNFFSQLPVFVLGLLTYWLMRHREAWAAGVIGGAVALAVWIGAWTTLRGLAVHAVLSLPIAMGAAFALLALLLERWPVPPLVNRFTTTVGKLSFSMYLTHFAVLDGFVAAGLSARFGQGDDAALFHYACVVSVTMAMSWICYRVVERPGIAAGRRLIDRLEGARGTIGFSTS